MGSPIPLTWSEILAWASLTKTEITPDEVLLLRNLSKHFVSSFSESKNPNTPAPFTDASKVDQDVVKQQLLAWAQSFPKQSTT